MSSLATCLTLPFVLERIALADLVVACIVDSSIENQLNGVSRLASVFIYSRFIAARPLLTLSNGFCAVRTRQPRRPRFGVCIGSLLLKDATHSVINNTKHGELPLQLHLMLAFRDEARQAAHSDFGGRLFGHHEPHCTPGLQAQFVPSNFVVGFGRYQYHVALLHLKQLQIHLQQSVVDAEKIESYDSETKVDIKILFSRVYVVEETKIMLNQWHQLIKDALRTLLPHTDTLLYDFGVPSCACRKRRSALSDLIEMPYSAEHRLKWKQLPITYCQRCTARIAWRRQINQLLTEQLQLAIVQTMNERRCLPGSEICGNKHADESHFSWPLRILCSASCDFNAWFAEDSAIGPFLAKSIKVFDASWHSYDNSGSHIKPAAVFANVEVVRVHSLARTFLNEFNLSNWRAGANNCAPTPKISNELPTTEGLRGRKTHRSTSAPYAVVFLPDPSMRPNERTHLLNWRMFPNVKRVLCASHVNYRCFQCLHYLQAGVTVRDPRVVKIEKTSIRRDRCGLTSCQKCQNPRNYDNCLSAPLYTLNHFHGHFFDAKLFSFENFPSDRPKSWQVVEHVDMMRKRLLCNYCARCAVIARFRGRDLYGKPLLLQKNFLAYWLDDGTEVGERNF